MYWSTSQLLYLTLWISSGFQVTTGNVTVVLNPLKISFCRSHRWFRCRLKCLGKVRSPIHLSQYTTTSHVPAHSVFWDLICGTSSVNIFGTVKYKNINSATYSLFQFCIIIQIYMSDHQFMTFIYLKKYLLLWKDLKKMHDRLPFLIQAM